MKQNNQAKKLPGFYIALCCCVVAIGVAGFISQNRETQSANTPTTAEETEIPYIGDSLELAEDTQTPSPTESVPTAPDTTVTDNVGIDSGGIDTANAVEDYTVDNPDIVSASVTVNAEESSDFCDPLAEMSVRFGFTADKLMYNEVYGDWRTHNGIDVTAAVGCSVSCVADGTVTDVSQGSYGKTVKIEHENGFTSVYAQLGDVNVQTGDSVTQGSVIGTVGESTGENLSDPHLHFELIKDGTPVNPEEY